MVGFEVFRVAVPTSPSLGPDLALFRFNAVTGTDKNHFMSYELVSRRSLTQKRLGWSLGVGATGFFYQESLVGLDMGGVYSTLKAGVSYALVPSKWVLGANAFGTLLPIWKSSRQTPHPRFIGANARVGYLFPTSPTSPGFGAHLGYYYWGMLVPDKSYGLSQVTGPQVFLTCDFGAQGVAGRSMTTYLKYAPLSVTGASVVGFSNYDLAAGFSVQLTSSSAPRPVSLTLDLDHLTAGSDSLANRVDLYTFSTGLQFSF